MDLNEFQKLIKSELIQTSFRVPKEILEKLREYRINYREVFIIGARLRLTESDRISEINQQLEESNKQVGQLKREVQTLRALHLSTLDKLALTTKNNETKQ